MLLTAHPDAVVIESRRVGEPSGFSGHVWYCIKPGETFGEITYEQLRRVASGEYRSVNDIVNAAKCVAAVAS